MSLEFKDERIGRKDSKNKVETSKQSNIKKAPFRKFSKAMGIMVVKSDIYTNNVGVCGFMRALRF